jgi:hypothetical protein
MTPSSCAYWRKGGNSGYPPYPKYSELSATPYIQTTEKSNKTKEFIIQITENKKKNKGITNYRKSNKTNELQTTEN